MKPTWFVRSHAIHNFLKEIWYTFDFQLFRNVSVGTLVCWTTWVLHYFCLSLSHFSLECSSAMERRDFVRTEADL